MKNVAPYLRVVAGMFAAISLWLAVVETINGKFGNAAFQLVFALILGYLSIGKPLRDRRHRIRAERAAIAARAEAGHRAFLAGDLNAAMTPPPEPAPAPTVRRGVVIAAAIAAVLVIVGIVGDIADGLDSPSDDNATTTSQTTIYAEAPPSQSTWPATSPATTARTTAPVSVAPATTTPANAATTSAAPRLAVMPDVVCMDLQEAQDAIQAAGVFYSRSVDATGRGRAQVWDRNWIVVDQSPPPGTVIGEGDAVLSVVKDDEFSGC
ncbi:PASTA domain-containing protein [Rhodococcus sp. Z13]|uniref:PASTA domain-containing protein n=1 Tax=Rhodococcus sacchari TaxID=2962047 RepID=A0ACD4DFJ3_9NOCA|nr:PASTA domain-containing protein [Rhodococcus sp. Z13]UYP18754.1 PASTA domain-containing protein [Rhodococcus sp. Z13]